MNTRILGYVMVRNEWPLIGIAIAHALSAGIDDVVVLDHDSDDLTREGLAALKAAWPDRITLYRVEGDLFLQEAATALITSLAPTHLYDWVYVFDADELILTSPGLTLKGVLGSVDDKFDAVRYQLDQWVAPSDFDDLDVKDYDRISYRAVAPIFVELTGEILADEIERENLNFFDVPFMSKVIVRTRVCHTIAAGAHRLNTSMRIVESDFDPSLLRAGHLPLLSRRRLELKCQQGGALIRSGFPAGHGWQSQMLYHLQQAGKLDDFWLNHSVASAAPSALHFSATPVLEFDETISRVLADASSLLSESTKTYAREEDARVVGVRDGQQTLPLAVIQSLHLQIAERDAALRELAAIRAERDGALGELGAVRAERDGALGELGAVRAERDGALGELGAVRAERDIMMRSRSWRSTEWIRRLRARFLS